MAKRKNIVGKRFGKLKVVKRVESLKSEERTRARWLCKCDCGNEIVVFATYLQQGETRSCGCLKKEMEDDHLRYGYDSKRVNDVAMQLFKGEEPRKDSTTGYRGVSRYYTRKSNKERYRAWITVKGRRYYKGGFKKPEDAYYNGRLALEDEHLPKKDDKNEKG